MSANLSDFLVAVASDAERMSRFLADPSGEAQAAGLTSDEEAVVMSRDSRQLLASLEATLFANGEVSNKGKKKKKKGPHKRRKPGRKAPGKPSKKR